MKKIIVFISIILLFFLFSGVGCVKIKTKLDGGIFKSKNGAKSWQQNTDVLSISGHKSISGVDVMSMCLNPQDSKMLYLGTKKNGLFVSYDGAKSWQKVENLPQGEITALSPHPKAKNVFYVALGAKIFKSIDCCHTWQNIYLGVSTIKSLAVDPIHSSKVYAGLENGGLIRSLNGGQSWTNIEDFQGAIRQILINPRNSNVIYIATQGRGLWQSKDNGQNWHSFNENLANFPGSQQVYKIFLDKTNPDVIIISSDYGLLRSNDAGINWKPYKLLTSKHKIKIYSFAVNPNDLLNFYYVTDSTLYKSIDGGENWITKKLPSKRQPVELLIDPDDSGVLYLGVRRKK